MPVIPPQLWPSPDQAGTRSTVLAPLYTPLALIIGACVICAVNNAPPWLTQGLAGAGGLFAIAFLASYIYFALTNPEHLRSEGYKLGTLAIERGLFGDSKSGLRPARDVEVEVAAAVGRKNDS